jgi:hypothetical protein
MWRAGVSWSAPTHHAAYLVVGALAAEQLVPGHDVIVDAVSGPGPARAQWPVNSRAANLQAALEYLRLGPFDASDRPTLPSRF